MVNDNWQRLSWRLQQIANDFGGRKTDRPGQAQGVVIIEFNLFFKTGELVGWSKPERTPLEPVQFDTTIFDLQTLKNWNEVILALKRERGAVVKKILVVRNGEPVGWFKEEQAGETIRLPVRVAA